MLCLCGNAIFVNQKTENRFDSQGGTRSSEPMAGPFPILSYLQLVLTDPDLAAERYPGEESASIRDRIIWIHLLFLLAIPILTWISPIPLLLDGEFPSSWKKIFIAPFLAGSVLFLAFFVDRLLMHEKPPGLQDPEEKKLGNLTLLFYIPVTATAPFYFVHPIAGHFFLILAILYSTIQAIRIQSKLRNKSVLELIARFLFAGILLSLPLVLLLLIWNIRKTISIFQEIGYF